MANQQLKQLIAGELAAGHSVVEIAERHGYSPRGMARLCRTKEVQGLVEAEQARLLQASDRIMFRFLLHADALAQGMVEDATNPSSPRQMDARKYILDRILPSRSTSQGGVNVNLAITKELVKDLSEAMGSLGQRGYRAYTIEASPHLHEGKDVFVEDDAELPGGDPVESQDLGGGRPPHWTRGGNA